MFHGAYRLIMDSRYNPLVNIQDVTTRHLVMQMLAWMWCIIFSQQQPLRLLEQNQDILVR